MVRERRLMYRGGRDNELKGLYLIVEFLLFLASKYFLGSTAPS